MQVLFYFLIICFLAWLMLRSLYYFLHPRHSSYLFFSWGHFWHLFIVYLNLIVGFALIYTTLWLLGLPTVAFGEEQEFNYLAYLGNMIYFSTITMLTVGYGDMTPLGLTKALVIIQALIGYLLPAAFFISGLIMYPYSQEKNRAQDHK